MALRLGWTGRTGLSDGIPVKVEKIGPLTCSDKHPVPTPFRLKFVPLLAVTVIVPSERFLTFFQKKTGDENLPLWSYGKILSLTSMVRVVLAKGEN